jgi:small-conductance mechanosensitive channel
MGAALVGVIVVILVVRFILDKRYEGKPDQRFRLQLTLLVLSFIGLLIIIVVSPLSDTQQGQILSLIGILLSAAIALSSTTFVGNAMAGLMLRAVRSFGLGDFIRIGEHFPCPTSTWSTTP